MVWASVCLSVYHIVVLCQNGAILDHEIFTVCCPKDSSFVRQNFVPLSPCVRKFPLNVGVREGYPQKDVILPLLARLV